MPRPPGPTTATAGYPGTIAARPRSRGVEKEERMWAQPVHLELQVTMAEEEDDDTVNPPTMASLFRGHQIGEEKIAHHLKFIVNCGDPKQACKRADIT
ncbi:UNVERIFIED_CONTAM: hypothetical protein K2H54_063859 [Gekko kuhli]